MMYASMLYMGAASMSKLLPFIVVNLSWMIPAWLILEWFERRRRKREEKNESL